MQPEYCTTIFNYVAESCSYHLFPSAERSNSEHQVLGCSNIMINIAGVVSIVLFYLLILAVGIWAGRKKQSGNDSEEEVMLAGRSIGLFVGIFTMTGESVG